MRQPPITWIAVAFGAGLWVGLVCFRDMGSGRREAYVSALILSAALPAGRRTPLAAAIAVAAATGLLWGGAAVRERDATCAGQWSRAAVRTTRGASTVGAIVRLADPAPADGGTVDADVLTGACGGALRLRWPEGHGAAGGTSWVVAGRWAGDAGRGVLVVRRVRLIDAVPHGRGALRDRIVARSERLFGKRAPMVDALVLARRADLDPAIREQYARAGLAHLLAISGLHVGFLAVWVGALLGFARVARRYRLPLVVGVLGSYVWLLGFPAPALRAALMFGLRAAARWRERVVAPSGLLGLTALLLLWLDPWAITAVGAWLSVAAVGAVIWGDRAAAPLPRPVRWVAPACAATLVTAPITAFAFGTVAPIGVAANLVAIPLAGVAVPGLVMAIGASWLWPALSRLLAGGAGLGLALLDRTAGLAAAVPGGHVIMTAGWGAAAVWLGVALAAEWLWHSPRRPPVVFARVAFLALLLVLASWRDVVSLDECRCLTVFFLDVGQGDAALLRSPAGHWIVIDGGPRTPQGDAGRRVVVPFLRRAGARSVSAVVATHGDADHLGGVPAVIEAFPPRLVLEPGEPLGRPLYLEFLAAVEASGAQYRPARAGDRLALDGVTLEVLNPDSAWLALPVDVNEHGVVLRVTYGATRLVFQADAGLPVEARLAGHVGRVDVLKVGHHGSKSATSDAWLTELAPREAVISVGRHNHYGHPAPEVLERLAQHGITIMRTDRDGTITFTTDGHRAHTDISHHH